MSLSFRSILHWLRAGYPGGVPQEDYIALLGVLQRHLTESEIVTLVEQLRAQRGAEPLSRADIRAAAEEVLKGHATEDDVRRVAARLAAAGWPIADAFPADAPESIQPAEGAEAPQTSDAAERAGEPAPPEAAAVSTSEAPLGHDVATDPGPDRA